MSELIRFRPLSPADIEVRVGRVNPSGVDLLLYKDARCDMSILDEVVGAMNWQRFHEYRNGTNYCRVGIRDESGEWVWKEDCGTPSEFESKKGESSDAFKRACFSWGIGRELYTAPAIFIFGGTEPNLKANITTNKQGKYVCYDKFSVPRIRVEDGEITGLAISNDTIGKEVFSWKKEGTNGSK